MASRFLSPTHLFLTALLSISICISTPTAALNVAVTGATGRVGRLVVDSCLASGHKVTAVVRDVDKANGLFSDRGDDGEAVAVRRLDFEELARKGEEEVRAYVEAAFEGVDRVVWCASGFVDVPADGGMTRKEALDVVGMGCLLPSLSSSSCLGGGATNAAAVGGSYLDSLSPSTAPRPPSFVMLSSAGVTRPGWDDAKKEKYVGCADIPIVRMNPGGILGKKVVAEDMLREQEDGGIPYCVVRPTGLKFKAEEWPRGRSLLSQGDVAVGRMNADDLADLLVDLLSEPSATGKTFECVTLADYPPPTSWSPVLDRLDLDTEPVDEEGVYASYRLMQQLLPGENQDATRLEMGRTYEEVDGGEVSARVRGAAPTDREIKIASGVVNAGGGGDGGVERKSFRLRIKKLFVKS